MFLAVTAAKNPKLIEFAAYAHQRGLIQPNTYVLDLDTIQANASLLATTARQKHMHLYMMTKQLGRNPYVAKSIAEAGIPKAVAVDPWEAIHLAKSGVQLGNVGHLVQIPRSMIEEILTYQPEVITVFSVEKAMEINQIAKKLDRVQPILLKIVGEQDFVYEGQWGGFSEDQLDVVVQQLNKLSHVRVIGVTSFPCLLYKDGEVTATPNVDTVLRCANYFEQAHQISIQQINLPSLTSVSTLPLLKELGGTHAEPGHALTGTTPLHQQSTEKENPALVYVSEISHMEQNKAFAYSGGHYRRSHAKQAMIGRSLKDLHRTWVDISPMTPDAIDYYTEFVVRNQSISVGDTVISAFRTQIFVTRSDVAVVRGLHTSNPHITGIYDHLGKQLR